MTPRVKERYWKKKTKKQRNQMKRWPLTRMKATIDEDTWATIQEIANVLDITLGSVLNILKHHLHYQFCLKTRGHGRLLQRHYFRSVKLMILVVWMRLLSVPERKAQAWLPKVSTSPQITGKNQSVNKVSHTIFLNSRMLSWKDHVNRGEAWQASITETHCRLKWSFIMKQLSKT